MPINYDGLNELTLFYATTIGTRIIQHRFTIDFRPDVGTPPPPGTLFENIPTIWHNGSSSVLSDDVDNLMILLLPFWRPTTEFSRAEYWRYDAEPSQNKTFIGAYELGLPGTASAGLDVAAQQETMTMRTVGGNIMRFQLMEVVSSATAKQSPPFSPSLFEGARTTLQATNHPWVGRDNTRPLAAISWGSGQNEKLARKRYRE